MGLVFRKRLPVDRTGAVRSWVNLSRSGVSFSKRVGRLTVNSRGRATIRLGKGYSWRFKL